MSKEAVRYGSVPIFFIVISIIILAPNVVAAPCGIYVFDLDTDDNTITGKIQNTGTSASTVSYALVIEELSDYSSAELDKVKAIKNGSISMNPGQTHSISHDYSFGVGTFRIRLDASTDCGQLGIVSDSISMGHIILEGYTCFDPRGIEGQTRCDYSEKEYLECRPTGWEIISRDVGEYCYNCEDVCGDGDCNCGESPATCQRDCGTGRCQPGYTNKYRCAGNVKQRGVIYSDCTEEWKGVQECEYGCSDGYCRDEPGQVPGCGVKIKTFDFLNSVTKDGSPYVSVDVENTGDSPETITLSLRLNDSFKGSHVQAVDADDVFSKTFHYYPPPNPGKYQIELLANSNCGSSDRATATLNVIEQGQTVSPPKVLTPPSAVLQTSVDVYPTFIDMVAFNSKVLVVDIDSAVEQTFYIDVLGAPESWFEYRGNIMVEEEETVYIYITPQEPGVYELTVAVTAQGEATDYPKIVDLYVAPAEVKKDENTYFGYLMNRLTDMIEVVSSNVWAIVSLIIIALIVVIAIARKHLKTEYEDLLPG